MDSFDFTPSPSLDALARALTSIADGEAEPGTYVGADPSARLWDGPVIHFGRDDVRAVSRAVADLATAARWTYALSTGRFPLEHSPYPGTGLAVMGAFAALMGGPPAPGTYPLPVLDALGRAAGILSHALGEAGATRREGAPVTARGRMGTALEELRDVLARHASAR